MTRGLLNWIIAGSLLCLSIACQQKQKVDFNTEIRPILNQNCLSCHGGVKRAGGFSLLFRTDALEPTESGFAAIVPGEPENSEMIARLRHHDPELQMPLEKPPLTDKEVALLTQWIREGAEWEDHWAYVPPQKSPLPKVSQSSWPNNEIDHFVLAKIEANDLETSPRADQARLLRRLSLDLTGLPPTPEEVQAFLTDQSPEAYQHAVERLLASPHFGERWAAVWMDLARYADSQGYERDDHRTMWPYRDWLIKAFNQDKGFDDFTIEQLAGDLLPLQGPDQLIATAFTRNSMTNAEGGTDDEEFRVAASLDRNNTVWTVWQATTMECVQCHSHPYDPIRMQEYYKSLALFNNNQDQDLRSEFPNVEQYEAKDSTRIEEIIKYISEQDPMYQAPASPLFEERIKAAYYPRVIAGDCDDFSHATIYPDQVASNWTNNVNSAVGRTFMLKFADVDLSDIKAIEYLYAASGNESAIDLRLDDIDGPRLALSALKKTGRIRGNEGGSNDTWRSFRQKIPPTAGKHDLFLILKNTTGKVPDGILTLKELRLVPKSYREKPQIAAYRDSLRRYRYRATRTPILKARTANNLRDTYIFQRGNWLVPGDTVHADIPQSLSNEGNRENFDRLAFAQWLVSEDNPLTARVFVNRVWEQLFGRGIVMTLEDFGTQGFKPTHPELLDWLAVEFRTTHQWSLKALLRQIVLSATYQQSAKVRSEDLEKDADNIWLARGPRVRLSAEQIRDQALAVSGLLSRKMYGPSVMPPQPDGVWQVVYSGRRWLESEGEDRHRRALYTYWRRTTPYPSMVAFDSPTRELCMPRRIATNTPLQALVTLNDTVYLEAAAALAAQMMAFENPERSEKLKFGFERVLMESPSERQLVALNRLYEQALMDAKERQALNDPQEIEKTALTIVANALLNMDAFVMKS
ncbi:MAG: DUF1553 domain-containing protein [Bacteroidota bacterium]